MAVRNYCAVRNFEDTGLMYLSKPIGQYASKLELY